MQYTEKNGTITDHNSLVKTLDIDLATLSSTTGQKNVFEMIRLIE